MMGVLRPRGRSADGRAPSCVPEILFRPLYRGEVLWNRTRKRDRWGQHHTAERVAGEWISREASELRASSATRS